MRKWMLWSAALTVLFLAFNAWAGSSGEAPGGSSGGGGGAEPGLWAMMLFSAAPCAFFVRKALRSGQRRDK